MAKVKAIPDGLDAIVPYLCVRGGAAAIDFYKKAFGATEVMRMEHGGKIGHAELMIGNGRFYLADEHPEMGFVSPQTVGGSPVVMHLYVEDVDAFAKKAIAGGAKVTRPVETQFYGDRLGQFSDPFGHSWSFASHVEDVSEEEMARRAAQTAKYGQSGS